MSISIRFDARFEIDAKRAPNGPQTNAERTTNVRRTNAERTPNECQMSAEQKLNECQTGTERTPNEQIADGENLGLGKYFVIYVLELAVDSNAWSQGFTEPRFEAV